MRGRRTAHHFNQLRVLTEQRADGRDVRGPLVPAQAVGDEQSPRCFNEGSSGGAAVDGRFDGVSE